LNLEKRKRIRKRANKQKEADNKNVGCEKTGALYNESYIREVRLEEAGNEKFKKMVVSICKIKNNLRRVFKNFERSHKIRTQKRI